ncbi:ATP/GTP-binding protein [Nocardioides sediminis]|uniref:ATP/GTP-binding protein n=1 Tax=Nocardioides sediminis TaxID=433648 RepID=UPI000D313AB2|nr:ATP-binding protein [Nocardioides sediminis]
MVACPCSEHHDTRRMVLTGGPGAGKTAVLEIVRRSLCEHVRVLPEAASIVFGGGFPREDDPQCRRAAQLAIFHVQRQLEATGDAHNAAIVLCDRGTVDGLAYWPASAEDFWASTGTTLEAELERYDAVVHLRTPAAEQGYNRQNPVRIESAAAAAEIDARILRIWAPHPRRHLVEASGDFLDKAAATLAILRHELPECCAHHVRSALPEVGR